MSEEFDFDEAMRELSRRSLDGAFSPQGFIEEVERLQKKRYQDLNETHAERLEEIHRNHEEALSKIEDRREQTAKNTEKAGRWFTVGVLIFCCYFLASSVMALLDQRRNIKKSQTLIHKAMLDIEDGKDSEARKKLLEAYEQFK